MSRLLLALAVLAPLRAWAGPAFRSPTFDVLREEAGKDPAGKGTPEGAKSASGAVFSGEAPKPGAPGAGAQEKGGDDYDHYHFTGTAPMPGVSIYTPVKDADGSGHTAEPKPKPPVSPYLIGGLIGGGLLATGGGIAALAGSAGAAGGLATGLAVLGGGLLFLGGAAIAAGVILWFLNKKFGGK